MTPDTEFYKAIHALNRSKEFQQFTEYLRAIQADQDKVNRYADVPLLHRGQGRSQVIEELLAIIDGAAEVIRKQN